MGAVLQFALDTQYVQQECCSCGCRFALTLATYNKRKADGESFYCPNGHSQYFTETVEERLKREIDHKNKLIEAERRNVEWHRADAKREKHKAAALKGHTTRIKNRIGNGVCPCCKRSFQNLMKHMAHQHPTFKKETP